jgi:DNA repair protein RadA/Sms
LAVVAGAEPVPIGAVDLSASQPRPTGIDELDRVLGGGLVPGSVTLLGGEPGVGKSTLLTQLLGRWPTRALYVSAEESAQQVRVRAERLAAVRDELWLQAETSLPAIVRAIDAIEPDLVVIDSVQAIADPEIASAPGSVVQVRECAHALVREAKRRGVAVVLVGHVTKEGGLAGPRVLEHVVDTVLTFEGERHHALRLLRAVKHRFGPTTELGLFEMGEAGLVDVPDPSRLFLADRRAGVAGSVVVPTMEGSRPLLVELQALVARSSLPQPRRSAQGLDHGRLSLLLAVLERRAATSFVQLDVYASVVGGVKLTDPGTDLAVCLAAISALDQIALPSGLVVCGEVGLGGELRQVAHTPRRLAEASRLGFRRAIVPASAPSDVPGLAIERAATLVEAIERAFARPGAHPSERAIDAARGHPTRGGQGVRPSLVVARPP